MPAQVVDKITYGLKVDLILKVPTLFGVRLRLAVALCGLAAWLMRGRMSVELDPQVEID